MNKIKKFTKFKKSKKTNNKRNHKRRHMTRKLRGGIKELEEIFQEHDNKTRPINERINQIVSLSEINSDFPLISNTESMDNIERINENPQRKELVTREEYDKLRAWTGRLSDRIYGLIDDLDELPALKKYETMVPLLFKLGTNEAVFINNNITAFIRQNIPVPNVINGGPDYSSYLLDLYQIFKFKRLKKIDFNIIQSFRILLPGLDENGMPNIFSGTRDKIRILYNFFEEETSGKKYIYLSANAPRDGPIEYDLEGLKRILNQDGLLSPEQEPNGESSSGEEVEVELFPWKYKGKNYLKSSDNRVYDIKTQERIGKWNMNTNQIEPLSESSDDSE
jgi:hypothetical protein